MSSNITITLRGKHQASSFGLHRDDLKPKRHTHDFIREVRSHFYERVQPHYQTFPLENQVGTFDDVVRRVKQLITRS